MVNYSPCDAYVELRCGVAMCVLPKARESWVPVEKVRDYLLNLDHTKGSPKAQFFISQGFDPDHWQILRDALIKHAQRGVPTFSRRSRGFDLWRVLGLLDTPSGKRPLVFSVWVIENEGAPRLVSAYPR